MAGLALLAVTVTLYIPAIRSDFIWDDDSFLTENKLIHHANGLRRFWFSAEPPDYFPLTSTMLWLEWRLWGGEHAAGYHMVNVMLHAMSAILFWRVLGRLRVPGAWAAALVFAVHPVNVESVAWITERKNVMPMVFALAALLCYLISRAAPRPDEAQAAPPSPRRFLTPVRAYWLAIVLFLLALLSKTSVVMLPVVLLGIEWWRKGRIRWPDIRRTLPFFTLAALLSLVTIWFQHNRAIGDELIRADNLAGRAAVAGRAVWFYLGKALMPTRLCFVYPRWDVDASLPLSYVPLILLLCLFGLLWFFRRDWARTPLFALGGYVVTLFPVLGFFDIYFMRYSLVADHWQYTSLPFLIAFVIGGAAHVLARHGRGGHWLPRASVAMLAALLALLTWRQQAAYADEEALWQATLKRNDGAWIAHNNLGAIYSERSELSRAMPYLRETLRLKPDHAEAHNNIGNIQFARGQTEQALASYFKAITYRPRWAAAHFNVAVVLLGEGRLADAERHLRTGLKEDPDSADAHYNLGTLLGNQGRLTEAVEAFRQALRVKPEHAQTHHNLAVALEKLGRNQEAQFHYRRAAGRARSR